MNINVKQRLCNSDETFSLRDGKGSWLHMRDWHDISFILTNSEITWLSPVVGNVQVCLISPLVSDWTRFTCSKFGAGTITFYPRGPL